MYTYDQIKMLEEQERALAKQIKLLQKDRRKIQNILRHRRIYEEKMGYKVPDNPRYINMTPDELKKYNREKQREYRKRIKEG